MAGSEREKDTDPADSYAADRATSSDEPLDEEKAIASEAAERDEIVPDDERSSRDQRQELNLLQSTVTETSIATAATSRNPEDGKKKPWHAYINPLRWGRIRPVPKERTVCPEYKAGFFSMLLFQWMQPLMTVSKCSIGDKLTYANHYHCWRIPADLITDGVQAPTGAQRHMDCQPKAGSRSPGS